MSRLPSDISNAITSVSARITIDAPVSTVWNVLLDFPSYPLWNTFVRTAAVTDASFKPLLAHPKPKEGDHVLLHVRMPPIGLHDNDKGLNSVKAIIIHVDEEHHSVSWGAFGWPTWFLRTQRWQELSEEHVDGRTTTTYTSIETFNGIGAWLIRWFFRTTLMTSFRVMAEGLKSRSEEIAANARSS